MCVVVFVVVFIIVILLTELQRHSDENLPHQLVQNRIAISQLHSIMSQSDKLIQSFLGNFFFTATTTKYNSLTYDITATDAF